MFRTTIVVAALFAVAAAVPIVDRDLMPVVDRSKIEEINSMQVLPAFQSPHPIAPPQRDTTLPPSPSDFSPAVLLDCRCQRELRWHDPA